MNLTIFRASTSWAAMVLKFTEPIKDMGGTPAHGEIFELAPPPGHQFYALPIQPS